MDEREKLLEMLIDMNDEIDYEENTSLIDDGLIDSLTLTQIITEIDAEFGIHIPTGEIEPENFNSVEGMLALIEEMRKRA